jgi:hypothetical protein
MSRTDCGSQRGRADDHAKLEAKIPGMAPAAAASRP